MFVIDNFLPFYDDFIHATDRFRYFSATDTNLKFDTNFKWHGRRTLNMVQKLPKVTEYIEERLQIRLNKVNIHKHDAMPDMISQRHTDGDFNTAGVIYLKGGPGCGTEVDGNLIEYRQNRLITYNAQLMHAPQGFPCERMVIVFFSRDALPDELPTPDQPDWL